VELYTQPSSRRGASLSIQKTNGLPLKESRRGMEKTGEDVITTKITGDERKTIYVVYPKGKISTWHTPQRQRKKHQVMCWEAYIDKPYALACLPVTNEKSWLRSEKIFRAIKSSFCIYLIKHKYQMSDIFFLLVNYVNVCSNSIPFRPDAHKRGRKRLANKKTRKMEKRRGREARGRQEENEEDMNKRKGRRASKE
jgi:hypothetical protein